MSVVFVPWSDLEVYRYHHVKGIGYVLDVGGLNARTWFLPTMREYDEVEAAVGRNLVEVTKW